MLPNNVPKRIPEGLTDIQVRRSKVTLFLNIVSVIVDSYVNKYKYIFQVDSISLLESYRMLFLQYWSIVTYYGIVLQ